jgi:hypothetical protein
VYEPGASIAQPTSRPSAQVWLVDPRRQLLTALGTDYVEKFAYNLDGVAAMMNELGDVLARREPPPGLSAEELLSRAWWSGPEIFLIIDDVQQLPPGFDSPLQKAAPWVTRAGAGQRSVAGHGRRPRRGLYPRQDEGWTAASRSWPADGRGHRGVRPGCCHGPASITGSRKLPPLVKGRGELRICGVTR